MYERFYGDKYNGKLSTVEIAKLIRQDIKNHIEMGCLPDAKYSVRSKYFSGGSSIDVHVSNLEHKVYTPEMVHYLKLREFPPIGVTCYTKVAENLLNTVQKIMDQYNHDGSEIQSDYFDVNFYGHVAFDWEWLRDHQGVIYWLTLKRITKAKRN